MRRVWILAIFIGIWLCMNPVMAQSRQTVYPESRRYSIEIPDDWVYATRPSENYFFLGESLQIADSQETLDVYFETNEVLGQLITIEFVPVSTLALFGFQTQNVTERQMLMNAFVGQYQDYELQFAPIAGYPAATVDLTGTSDEYYGGFVFQSAIWVEDVIVYMVTVAGSPQEMNEIDRLLPTFKFYSQPRDCATGFSQRPALSLENGAVSIPLQTCWLVLTADYVNSPYNLRQLPRPEEDKDVSGLPYHHLIFWDSPIEFMRRVNASYLSNTGMTDRSLVAGMMQIGVYPYSWFDDNPETDATLQVLFEQIGGYAQDYAITRDPVFTIRGRLSQVFDNPDNVGRFMMIADGAHVYLIIIATPSALWSQLTPIAEDLLSQVIIT